MDNGREETTSQTEKVEQTPRSITLEQMKEITDKQVSQLNELIEKMQVPEGNPEWLKQPCPFTELEYHTFVTDILTLKRDLLQVRLGAFQLIVSTFDHVLGHLDEVKEQTSAVARISAGEAVLEMLEPIIDNPTGEHQTKHIHN